jgi:hypothetical protein
VEVTGRVEMQASAKGEVTVSLTGLPAGVAAPNPAKVKEGQPDFKFTLKFPPSVAAGKVAGIRVSAQGTPFGNGVVKTQETEVSVTLRAPDPAAPKPSE